MKKFRPETVEERIERMHHIYDGGPKPKHYDNPNVIDQENLRKKPKPFNNNDRSTYPSNRDQKQRINTWDIILDDTIKNGSPADKKELREYLKENAKDPLTTRYFTKKELNFMSTPKPAEIKIPKIDFPTYSNLEPTEKTLEEKILEERFNKMLDDQKKEKERIRNFGLAGLMGGDNDKK